MNLVITNLIRDILSDPKNKPVFWSQTSVTSNHWWLELMLHITAQDHTDILTFPSLQFKCKNKSWGLTNEWLIYCDVMSSFFWTHPPFWGLRNVWSPFILQVTLCPMLTSFPQCPKTKVWSLKLIRFKLLSLWYSYSQKQKNFGAQVYFK